MNENRFFLWTIIVIKIKARDKKMFTKKFHRDNFHGGKLPPGKITPRKIDPRKLASHPPKRKKREKKEN